MIRRRFKVKSTNLRTVGYDVYARELEVTFLGSEDTVYTYKNVTANMFAELMNSESIGEWFSSQIKANKTTYPFTKSLRGEKK